MLIYSIYLILNLAFALLMFFLTLSFLTGAPFVPSTTTVSQRMIDLADISPGTKLYDLGSGDGRLLFLAAERGACAVGYEINPYLVAFTYIKRLFSPRKAHVHIYWKNFWNANISDADVVCIYLLPWRMADLRKKLETELKPGTRIVSNSFIFSGWKPLKEDASHHVYVYVVPKKESLP